MPNFTIEKFKFDRNAQFAATLCECKGKEGKEGDIYSRFIKDFRSYQKRLFNWVKSREKKVDFDEIDEDSDELKAYNAAKKASLILEDMEELVNKYPDLNRSMQKRDLIIDVKKLFDEFQEQLDIMEEDFNYTNEFKEEYFGTKGYIENVTKHGMTSSGLELLTSDVFDEKNLAVVNDFNRSYSDPVYHKKNNDKSIKSYFYLKDRAFNQFLESRNLKNQEIAFEGKNVANFDPKNAFIKDEPDQNYCLSSDYIKRKQTIVKSNILNAFQTGQDDLKGNSIYADLYRFKETIQALHDEIGRGKYNSAEPKVKNAMKHLDQILWQRPSDNPDNGLLRKINYFLTYTKDINAFALEEDELTKLATGDLGFTGILRSLKCIQEDPEALPTFKKLCLDIQKKLENVFETSINAGIDNEYEKYVIRNTGDLIINKDKDTKSSIAKVVTAYEWKKKEINISNEADRPAFNAEEMDVKAKEMLVNPLFRARYVDKNEQGEETWNDKKMKNDSKNHEEWRINNRIEKPLSYDSVADTKREALKNLQELGKIIGSAEGASEGYQNFNRTLKELGTVDISKVPSEQLGGMLDKIYKATESYMKGRKSKRWTDSQQEHFDQTLDVLAIISKTGKNGEELATKLVDRTNYVRKHRWHHLYEQDTVTLEGRSNQATRERINGIGKSVGRLLK